MPEEVAFEMSEDSWEFSDPQHAELAEVHFADTEQEEAGSGLLKKTILRTGTFPAIPTGAGLIKRPLKIVKEGKSDMLTGTISLEEIKRNFDQNAIPKVQIPLSDEKNDHKNITRVNTGFVEDLEIEEDEDGAKLVAKMNFTEPEVKEKVLRGTFADVSCGIPWNVTSRGQPFGTALEHVAITNRPFLPDLGPFVAASDQLDDADIVHFATSETMENQLRELLDKKREEDQVADNEKLAQLGNSVATINPAYTVQSFSDNTAVVKQNGNLWIAPYTTTTSGTVNTFTFLPNEWWKPVEESAERAEEPPARTEMSDLDIARRLREVRLSQGNSKSTKEVNMPLSREELDRLELSDEQKGFLSELLDENATYRAQAREAQVENRLEELKKLGLEQRPGALKLYRTVALADDGGAAAVLLSDNGQQEQITALEILDRFIEAIKGSDGKVQLSDQNLVPINDDGKPPADAEGEVISFEDRLAQAKQALGEK